MKTRDGDKNRDRNGETERQRDRERKTERERERGTEKESVDECCRAARAGWIVRWCCATKSACSA